MKLLESCLVEEGSSFRVVIGRTDGRTDCHHNTYHCRGTRWDPLVYHRGARCTPGELVRLYVWQCTFICAISIGTARSEYGRVTPGPDWTKIMGITVTYRDYRA